MAKLCDVRGRYKPMVIPDGYMSRVGACQALRISTPHFNRLWKAGQVPQGEKHGKARLWSVAEINQYLAEQEAA